MEAGSSTKGHELMVVFLDNVSNLEMLYRFVATCSSAKNPFDNWPIHYLSKAISTLPDDLRQLTEAFIASAHLCFANDPYTPYVNSLPDLPLEDGENYNRQHWGFDKTLNERLACSKRQSMYTFFLTNI